MYLEISQSLIDIIEKKYPKKFNLSEFKIVSEEVQTLMMGPETSDMSHTSLVVLGHPQKNQYIYVSDVRYGNLKYSKYYMDTGDHKKFLDQETYQGGNGIGKKFYEISCHKISEFEAWKFMSELDKKLDSNVSKSKALKI